MTKEQFKKASEINKEIQKYDGLIQKIKLGISYKEREDEKARNTIENNKNNRKYNDHNERWTLSKFFGLTLDKHEVHLIPYYEFANDIKMDADTELIQVIIEYLKKKKKEYEEEFEQIGKKEI